MTRAFVRARRGGKWQRLEVEHLTDAEREAFFADSTPAELVRWLNRVCTELAGAERILDGLVADGIIQKNQPNARPTPETRR